ncbi:hypothetical protein PL8927_730007 [Planktothrix serta PCC 8927]|uniref:Uncharacterized protein n=1 Tax=Planktothrix serta PCC 8927 TaxID=671068 RepID=A0A7Z9E132_9CYAN|nr:hypothetical protein [Planktothrix serta]VXD22133.1 hypothetical protein PL8927_730007 [Planktothrix serta PCC 8927]
MLTLLLSGVVKGGIFLPEFSETAGLTAGLSGGVNSIVKISDTCQPFLILSRIYKNGDHDPIVPPN